MEEKNFYLSSTDKRIGGVCGGIAEYFGIDPLLVRVGFLLMVFMGYGLLLYLLLWILAPRNERQNGYQK